jgi:hypothetical protein
MVCRICRRKNDFLRVHRSLRRLRAKSFCIVTAKDWAPTSSFCRVVATPIADFDGQNGGFSGISSLSMITPEEFQRLIPLACRWAETQERTIIETGRPLTAEELELAQRMGIFRPQRIRILAVDEIPAPEQMQLRMAARQVGLFTSDTVGMTLRYGIFVQKNSADDQRLIAHELGHVKQYERMGGFRAFMERYLFECMMMGYPNTPMEQEADDFAERVVNLRAA